MSRSFLYRAKAKINRLVRKKENLILQARDAAVSQKLLVESYRINKSIRSFEDIGFGLYSQFDEDGILLYIFAKIGTTDRRAIEMCAGTGIECNTANLIINHRWTALLFDGNPENIEIAKSFYSSRSETRHWLPKIQHAWLTKENVNTLVEDAGYTGDIDLFSLDIDGMDYWIWKNLTAVRPRVVVLEFNHLLGPNIACTVPYQADFVATFTEYGADYSGASLRAFINLGHEKGYRFVGTNSVCTNAFFIRNDIPTSLIAEANPEDSFKHPRAIFGMNERYPAIKNKDWQSV